jgi:hypothetical protein
MPSLQFEISPSSTKSTATVNPFVKTVTEPLTDPRLSLGARLLLSLIRRWSGRKGYCWWGIGSISEKTGRCERTIQYWKKELIKAGLLERVECQGHSDYWIPDPKNFTADLRQFMGGSLIPRQSRYDPWKWPPPPEPTPEQPSLEIPIQEPPEPAQGVQNFADVIKKVELPGGAEASPIPESSILKTPEQEQPKQENLFIDETTTRGWLLVFSPEDPDLMVRVISHCTGITVETLRNAWDSLKRRRKGTYLRDIAVEFIQNVVSSFGGGILTPRASP